MLKNLRKKLPKWLNSELIFYIGVATLPFEDFFFAPSSGWAALAPLIFIIYLLLNIKLIPKTIVKLRQIFIFFVIAIILGSTTSFALNVNVVDYVNAFVPLILGAISLLSFFIFYEKKKDLKTVINIVVIAYAIACLFGLFEYLGLKLNNYPFIDFMQSFMKRDYLKIGRVQFFFTEPSFIGMHVFGILLPLYWLSKRKDLLFVTLLMTAEAVIFGSGFRIILDVIVIGLFYLFYLLKKHKLFRFVPLLIAIFALFFVSVYNNNGRVRKIVNGGIYSDGSFASRYFRSEASLIGYTKAPFQTLVGFGLGNSIKPIRLGYDEAIESYTNSFRREVDDLGDITFHEDSVSYNLYVRFVSEFGLILTIVALVWMFKITKNSRLEERWLYLAVILWLYVQFESLGFYAIWLYVATMYYTREDNISERTLDKRISDNKLTHKREKDAKQTS